MEIESTNFTNGVTEIVLSDGKEGGESIAVRMRGTAERTDSLALHQLTILQKARGAVETEIQRLKNTLDQASLRDRF